LQRQKSAMDLLLVEETSRYMFRILAAKYFFEHPEQFGFNVPENERYRYRKPRKVVAVETPVESLIDFAEQNGISYAALKNANPWLRDTLLTNKSGKRYEIIIP
ncbi:MAG: lytic transglycosylase domain-containing protein, partial [Bacteroidales bacterium]|nr:lytic transglycosylase domain-containing protein [Bacteroidales bacterium]